VLQALTLKGRQAEQQAATKNPWRSHLRRRRRSNRHPHTTTARRHPSEQLSESTKPPLGLFYVLSSSCA